MTTTQSAANRDVWSEILQYLEIDLVNDSENVQCKRRTILSVALTHPALVDVALDELWKSMVTLEPIVCIINASPTGSTNVLEYDESAGSWEISLTASSNNPFSRARLYLSRIQYLHFDIFPAQREYTLWAAISNLGNFSPVCPSLRKICLGPGLDIPVAIYNLAALSSPTLQSAIFQDIELGELRDAGIPTLLSLFRCHDVQLREISYSGSLSPRIVQHIFGFPTLRSVKILSYWSEGIDANLLRGLDSENLTSLDINLDVFQEYNPVGDWLAGMPSLLTLSLSGSCEEIYACINDRVYNCLQSLSLSFDVPIGEVEQMDEDVFPRISDAFPRLQSLCISSDGQVLAEMTILDMLALREKPLKVLELHHLPMSLSTADIINILTVWPSLKRLHIVPQEDHFECEAKVILSYMSDHASKLLDVDIPLNFSSLTETALLSLPRCICPLQKLGLSKVLDLPQNIPEKLTLCRNLIWLFPKLTTLTPWVSKEVAEELQAIVNLVRDVLSFPSKR